MSPQFATFEYINMQDILRTLQKNSSFIQLLMKLTILVSVSSRLEKKMENVTNSPSE